MFLKQVFSGEETTTIAKSQKCYFREIMWFKAIWRNTETNEIRHELFARFQSRLDQANTNTNESELTQNGREHVTKTGSL